MSLLQHLSSSVVDVVVVGDVDAVAVVAVDDAVVGVVVVAITTNVRLG